MRIIPATAAPRVIDVAGEPVLVSPPSIRDLGLLVAFLEDHVPPPAGAPDDWRPSLGGPEAEALFSGPAGLPLILYAAMRRDNPEIRLAAAYEMAGGIAAADVPRLLAVVFERTATVAEHQSHCARWLVRHRRSRGLGGLGGDEQPRSLDAVGLGAIFEEPALRGFAPDVIAGWTLDQLENKRRRGRGPDGEDGSGNIDMSPAEVIAYAKFCREEAEARAQAEAKVEAGGEAPGQV